MAEKHTKHKDIFHAGLTTTTTMMMMSVTKIYTPEEKETVRLAVGAHIARLHSMVAHETEIAESRILVETALDAVDAIHAAIKASRPAVYGSHPCSRSNAKKLEGDMDNALAMALDLLYYTQDSLKESIDSFTAKKDAADAEFKAACAAAGMTFEEAHRRFFHLFETAPPLVLLEAPDAPEAPEEAEALTPHALMYTAMKVAGETKDMRKDMVRKEKMVETTEQAAINARESLRAVKVAMKASTTATLLTIGGGRRSANTMMNAMHAVSKSAEKMTADAVELESFVTREFETMSVASGLLEKEFVRACAAAGMTSTENAMHIYELALSGSGGTAEEVALAAAEKALVSDEIDTGSEPNDDETEKREPCDEEPGAKRVCVGRTLSAD